MQAVHVLATPLNLCTAASNRVLTLVTRAALRSRLVSTTDLLAVDLNLLTTLNQHQLHQRAVLMAVSGEIGLLGLTVQDPVETVLRQLERGLV